MFEKIKILLIFPEQKNKKSLEFQKFGIQRIVSKKFLDKKKRELVRLSLLI